MEKMEILDNSPFYAMHFDHGITYAAAYLETLTCLFSHTRLLKAHTKLLAAQTRLPRSILLLFCSNSNSSQFHSNSDTT